MTTSLVWVLFSVSIQAGSNAGLPFSRLATLPTQEECQRVSIVLKNAASFTAPLYCVQMREVNKESP